MLGCGHATPAAAPGGACEPREAMPFDEWASVQRRRAALDGAWKVEVSERVAAFLAAAFLAGLTVSLTTPRERPGWPTLAFRFFSLQRSRSQKKKKPDDRMLAHTHSQISSPPCIHHSFSPWALYSLSSTLGCQGGRLVRSDKGRICLCPLVPTEHMLSNVHAILARHQSRLPLGPTRLGRQLQKLRGRPHWKEGG